MFDYAAIPAPEVEGIHITTSSNADSVTVRWFPDLLRGMEAGWMMLQEHYARLLTGVRVEIRKIYEHQVDTTSIGCEYYGKMFIDYLGRDLARHESSSGTT